MKHCQQFTREQRYQFYGLRKAGFKQRKIANEVGRNKSAISCELRLNGWQCGWHSKQAQELRYKRVRQKAKARRFGREDRNNSISKSRFTLSVSFAVLFILSTIRLRVMFDLEME
jgi:IS30 family transposase